MNIGRQIGRPPRAHGLIRLLIRTKTAEQGPYLRRNIAPDSQKQIRMRNRDVNIGHIVAQPQSQSVDVSLLLRLVGFFGCLRFLIRQGSAIESNLSIFGARRLIERKVQGAFRRQSRIVILSNRQNGHADKRRREQDELEQRTNVHGT